MKLKPSLTSTAAAVLPAASSAQLPGAARSPDALPPAFINFDKLPDSAQVRVDVVEHLFSCSEATVWRMAKDGRLPPPRKYSPGISVWNVGELRRAMRGDK